MGRLRAPRLLTPSADGRSGHRVFAEYVAGRGMTSIARGLTQDGIACPSAYDRERNPHRRTEVWETAAVRAILLNPR